MRAYARAGLLQDRAAGVAGGGDVPRSGDGRALRLAPLLSAAGFVHAFVTPEEEIVLAGVFAPTFNTTT